MCFIEKTSYIWRLCWTLSFIWLVRCAELQKTLMFDAVVDTPLLCGTCDKLLLHCKRILLLHCKSSYIWRLCSTTSFIWHSRRAACWKPLIFRACVELRLLLALPISSIAKYFLHLTLVLNFLQRLCCTSKTRNMWRMCWTSSFICNCRCAALRITSYVWRLCWNMSFV